VIAEVRGETDVICMRIKSYEVQGLCLCLCLCGGLEDRCIKARGWHEGHGAALAHHGRVLWENVVVLGMTKKKRPRVAAESMVNDRGKVYLLETEVVR
jgi:hypothetical protein